MSDRRIPPHDLEAERSLLGVAIMESKRMPEIIGLVAPEDFYGDKNREIFNALVNMAVAEKTINLASIYEFLEGKVSATDIAKLIDGVQNGSDIQAYGRIIKDKATLRRIIHEANKLAGAAYDGNTDEAANLMAGMTATKLTGKRDHAVSEDVQKWVETTTGPFSITDCVNSIQGMTVRDRPNVRTALHRLKDRGIIEPTGKRDGIYRLIQNDCPEMEWRNAPDKEIPFVLPLGLNELVSLYGKSMIVVAGQSNQGKSAILLNMIKDNMKKFKIHYFTSEFGPSKVKKRFSLFDDVTLDDWNVKVYARAHDFHDIIRPDDVNIIDWLWSGTAFYEAGGDLVKIFNKLNEGIAAVALQKDPGKEYGRGGAITMDVASLYLSVFPGEVKIIKAKDWKTDDNPNGKTLKIKIVKASKLIPGHEGWQYQESRDALNPKFARNFGG